MNFPEYCISKGYKCYRKKFDKTTGQFSYVETDFKSVYSTLNASGGECLLDYRLKKEGCREIVFGLNEAYKPPTLCEPRPSGIYTDDDMNRLLLDKTPEEIFNMIQ